MTYFVVIFEIKIPLNLNVTFIAESTDPLSVFVFAYPVIYLTESNYRYISSLAI